MAVDTSTLAGGVALFDGERVVGEYLLDVRITHSERLLPAIDRLLRDAGWTTDTLEGLAVAIGPGSFTGLRIGLSAVKGLGWALGLRVAAIPTLDAMAAALPFAGLPVCPVLDARQNELFCALYRWDGATMHREWDYLALAPDVLAARLVEPTILMGEAASSVPSRHARLAPPHRRVPSAAAVGVLGLARFRAGDVVSASELLPFYLRPSQAELKRRAVPVH
jgi:tRNA threonylcarbamoyladenosine biosynthesis protein TsaB